MSLGQKASLSLFKPERCACAPKSESQLPAYVCRKVRVNSQPKCACVPKGESQLPTYVCQKVRVNSQPKCACVLKGES